MAVWDDILGEISSQSRSLFKGGKKVFTCRDGVICGVGVCGDGIRVWLSGWIGGHWSWRRCGRWYSLLVGAVYYFFALGWLVFVIWIGKCFLLLTFLLVTRTLLIPDRYFFFFSIVRYQKSACGSSIAVRATWNLSPGSLGSTPLYSTSISDVHSRKVHTLLNQPSIPKSHI